MALASVAACGDGRALTRDQYVAQLDAACAAFAAREREIGEPNTLSDLVKRGPKIASAFADTVLDPISTLHPPDEIAAQANRLVVLARRQLNVLEGLAAAARRGDLLAVQRLAEENRTLNARATTLTRALGATACVNR
jgi:hypothetical protein